MTMREDQYTHDLHGNQVDGWYWQLTEKRFRSNRLRHRDASCDALAVLDRLVETTDDVLAEVMQEQQELWNNAPDGDFFHLKRGHDEMIEAIVRGEYVPESATVFLMDFVRRMTGMKPC